MVIDEKKIRDTYSKISHLKTSREKMGEEEGKMFDAYVDLLGENARGLIDGFREMSEVYIKSRDFEQLPSREKGIIYYQLYLMHVDRGREYLGESRRLCDEMTKGNREESILRADLEGITGTADILVGREFANKAYRVGGLPQTVPLDERKKLFKRYIGSLLDQYEPGKIH